jgi:predicted DNA-binding transcriptional regulator YafY
MSESGRHSLEAIERLLRILAVLEAAGAGGVRHDRLPRLAGCPAGPGDPRRRFARDIGELNRAGWEIISVGTGSGMRYVLTVSGTRLQLQLDRAQEAELLRASRSAPASREDDVDRAAEGMAECVRAVGSRALISFEYGGRPRRVHPCAVQPGPAGWYLVGREESGHVDRHFAIARMLDIEVGAPGSARVARSARRGGHDPLSWLVDPPEEVRLRVAARFASEVEQALGVALRREPTGDDVVLTVAVTHQAAFRHRLYALGGRVEVLSPERVRAGIVAELSQLAGSR